MRRVHSTSRSPSATSLPIVTFLLYKGTKNLAMLPDMGADENIIDPQHLKEIVLATGLETATQHAEIPCRRLCHEASSQFIHG